MKRIKKKRLYFVSGLALVMLLVLPVWKLMTYVVADQTSGYVVKANMTLNRTIKTDSGTTVTEGDKLQINQNISLNYTIAPQAVSDSNTARLQQQVVTNLVFTEKLPPNLNILDSSLPAGFSKTGDLSTGYILTGILPDITYTWNQTKQAFIANADDGQTSKLISFSLPAQVTNTGSFSFSKGTLSFNDIHSVGTVATTPPPTPAATFNPNISSTDSLLGVAGDYNVFVFEEAKITASVAGNIAAGGNVTTGGVSINEGYKLSVPYALVTGGDLNFTNGTVYGNILHQGEYLKNNPGNIVGGTYKKGSLIDFGAARSYYETYSSNLASIKATGTTTEIKYGGFYATATQPVSVFDFTSDYYNQANWTNLTAPAGATLIFNVHGTTVNFTKAFALPNGVSGNNVIYNFPDATSVSISSGEYRGSILAPKAAISFTNGQIHGNIIGKSINSSSTVGILPYKGQMPPTSTATPSPVATASPTPAPTAPPKVTLEFSSVTITVIRPVTEIQMEGTTLLVRENKLLSATVLPYNASITTLQWSSADPAIAIVNQNGQVTGVSEGTAQITARATDGSGISRTVDVIVKRVPVTAIQLEGTTLILGESKPLTATVVPSNATTATLQWSSADSSIVTVDQNGQVTGVTVGRTMITAAATDGSGVSRTVEVIVKRVAIEVTDIQLSGTSLIVDETKQLIATVIPANASIPLLDWSSSNSGIVRVDQSGNVTGVAAGTALITASSTDDSDVHKTVSVEVRKLEISGGNSTQINKDLDLTAVYFGPTGETGLHYTWSIVSGPSGATVSPQAGKSATFTASSLGNYAILLSFTSDSLSTPIRITKQISVDKTQLTDFTIIGENQVYAGRNLGLSLDLKPANADIAASDITWSITGDNNGTYASLSDTDVTKLGNTLVAKTFKKDSTTGAALETTVTVTARIGSIEKSLVVDILPMVLRFSKGTHVLFAGEASNLADLLYLYPYDIPLSKLEWTSSNNAVASFANIHDGTITAHSPGNVKVTVVYKPSQDADPVSATIVVQVKLPDNKDKY